MLKEVTATIHLQMTALFLRAIAGHYDAENVIINIDRTIDAATPHLQKIPGAQVDLATVRKGI